MTHLFDAPRVPRPRWRGSRALVLLDQARCVRCLSPLDVVEFTQLPLFFHGGYGEATREVHHNCPECRTTRKVLVAAVSPLAVYA